MRKLLNLGQVCHHVVYGVTASAIAKADGPRLLRITDITALGVNWSLVPGCNISGQEHSKSKLLSGDIVVARTGGTVGKSFLVTDPPDAVCASYLLRLRPNTSIVLPEYLHLFLRSACYWEQLFAGAQGAAQPNVNGTTLSKIHLRVPSLDAQATVVAQLKDQLAHVDMMRAALRTQLKEVELLPQKLLARPFSD